MTVDTAVHRNYGDSSHLNVSASHWLGSWLDRAHGERRSGDVTVPSSADEILKIPWRLTAGAGRLLHESTDSVRPISLCIDGHAGQLASRAPGKTASFPYR